MLQVSAQESGAQRGRGVEFGLSENAAARAHLLIHTSDRVCRLLRLDKVLVQLERANTVGSLLDLGA